MIANRIVDDPRALLIGALVKDTDASGGILVDQERRVRDVDHLVALSAFGRGEMLENPQEILLCNRGQVGVWLVHQQDLGPVLRTLVGQQLDVVAEKKAQPLAPLAERVVRAGAVANGEDELIVTRREA